MQVLSQLPQITDPNVLVGVGTVDDAGVYRLTDEIALVQTVDFFTPVVDEPHAFGEIAVANALSDVYAMGGKPIVAMNIVAFPTTTLPISILAEILRGGAEKAGEAGVVIIGGHSIDDPEPKYGLAVSGIVHPERIVTNAGARPGDQLILTKPLGVGIITTAIKRALATPEMTRQVVGLMATLNKTAADAMLEVGVHACTDVTGFGLLGHLFELCVASGVGAEVYLDDVPVLPETWGLASRDVVPGGTRSNLRFLDGKVTWQTDIKEFERLVLADAQTSGGLLIAVPADKTDAILRALRVRGTPAAARVGAVVAGEPGQIAVRRR